MTNCKFYSNGDCTYFAEARNGNDLRTTKKRCCMRIVKPQIKCFNYQPKIGKEVKP